MKKIIFALFISLVTFGCKINQQHINAIKNTEGNLVGIANKQTFNQEPYNTWFSENYNNYTVDNETILELSKHLEGIKIKGFMGTWCSDSRRETPHFYKILEAANFDTNNLTLITVNKDKETPNHLEKGLNILRVPTFIFYKNNVEIGRYVEYARETMEKDFLKIVSGKEYFHSYEEN